MNTRRIVITGGPGTGKTAVINGLEDKNFYCYHEVIRELTLAAKNSGDLNSFETNPIALVTDSNSFNKKLLEGRVAHYKASLKTTEKVVFFDRGIPDVLAYMDYFNQKYDDVFVKAATENKYDIVFLLPMWERIYTKDEERFESYKEGEAIEKHLIANYKKCGYTVIVVPKDTIQNRICFILKELNLN